MVKKGDLNFTVYKNVVLGKGSVIEPGVIIGLPPFGFKEGGLKTLIGKNCFIRANTIIYAGVRIGDNFQTGPNVLIRENNKIGNDVVIWHNTTLNPENTIGNQSRIHANCFLEKVTLAEKVFLGPNVIFTDDPHPGVPIKYRECWGGANVGKATVIGGNSTILPHISIGDHVLVGAGSVVTRNIPSGFICVGNPAKITKKITSLICKRSKNPHYPYKDE